MARIYGSNKILGTIGGVRHYRLPGCDFIIAAEKGGANGNLIKNNPAFARTRENNEEWKGVTLMAKQVKWRLGLNTATVVNRFLIGALNKAMVSVLRRDPVGERGSRTILLSAHKNVLDSIQYWYYKPFRDIMKCRFEVDTGPDRKSVTVRLSTLVPKEQIKAPAEATHFQFCLSIGAVCDVAYSEELKGYSRVYSGDKMQYGISEMESEWIPINAKSQGEMTFTVALPEDFQLEEDMTVLRIFGIVFGKMTYEVEELKRDRGSAEFLGAV
jgi:hypothetical protein